MAINIKTIDIVGRSIDRLQDSRNNLAKISAARQKAQNRKTELDIKKKEQDLKLQKAKNEGLISEMDYNIRKKQFDEYIKQEEDKQKGQVASIDLAEDKQMNMRNLALNTTKQAFEQDQEGARTLLGAIRRNQRRRTELRPKTVGGKTVLEEVDLEQEALAQEKERATVRGKQLDVAKQERGYGQMDVVEKAISMAKSVGSEDFESYIPRAESMLKGETPAQKKEPIDKNAKVKVQLPDGRTGYIPKQNLKRAQDAGWKLID